MARGIPQQLCGEAPAGPLAPLIAHRGQVPQAFHPRIAAMGVAAQMRRWRSASTPERSKEDLAGPSKAVAAALP